MYAAQMVEGKVHITWTATGSNCHFQGCRVVAWGALWRGKLRQMGGPGGQLVVNTQKVLGGDS